MSESIECAWVVDVLPEYLAGRLPEEESERVRDHLEGCADCRNRANAVSLLQQTPVPAPDPGRWDHFVEGVVDRAERRRRKPRVLRLLGVAAVIAILAAAAVYWQSLGGRGESPPSGIDVLARDVAELPAIEAAAWTVGVMPLGGVAVIEEDGITDEELEQLVEEVGRT